MNNRSAAGRIEERIENLPLAERGVTAVEAERRALGFHHAEIGAITLKTFGLSEDILDAVRYHHDEERVPTETSNDVMELVVRASAGLLERVSIPKGLDISVLEEGLQGRIETAERERPGAWIPEVDDREGVCACREEVGRAVEFLLAGMTALSGASNAGMPGRAS